MCTLTIGPITWRVSKHEGKPSFVFAQSHAIFYHPDSKHYLVVEKGEAVHASKSVVECLEVSTEIVLDSLARDFKPSWYGSCDLQG